MGVNLEAALAAENSRTKTRSRRKSVDNAAPLDCAELEQLLGFRLRTAWSYMEHYFTKCFAGTGIKPQHYAILLAIEKNPSCRISDLCYAVQITPNNMVPSLDLLMKRGFVFREFSLHDRREKRLGLTQLGTSYLGELRTLHERLTAHFEERIGATNLDVLVRLLIQAAGGR